MMLAMAPLLLLALLASFAPAGSAVHLRAAHAPHHHKHHHHHHGSVNLHARKEEGEEAPAEGEEAAAPEAAAPEQEAEEEAPELEVPEIGTCQVVSVEGNHVEELEECLCDEGHFWNWRSKKCAKRGHLGYECGFFPKDLHERVCAEGLACKKVESADNHYFTHGRYQGTGGEHPAVCEKCAPEDKCHEKKHECTKKVTLDKDGEICVWVRFAKAAEANGTSLLMKHHRHTRISKGIFRKKHHKDEHHEHEDEHHEHEEEHHEHEEVVFSHGHACMSIYKAKQLLGANRIEHLDIKAAEEILEHAEQKLTTQACSVAEAAEAAEPGEPAVEEPVHEEEHHEGEEAPAEEAPAEGEEAPAEEAF